MFTSPATGVSINLKGQLYHFERPLVMGILNITPDSFFAASRCPKEYPQAIAQQARKLLNEGADILDLGAMSTRPGAAAISEAEEMERLDTALKVLRHEWPDVLISVDTYRSNIARSCVEHWAVDLINDISAGELDKRMLKTVAHLGVPYVLMHMQGTPQNMQQAPQYQDATSEIISYLAQRAQYFYDFGGKDAIADPGFGFGKNLTHNYELLSQLSYFHELHMPLLVGVSRKSMVYKALGCTPEQALNGTTALHAWALAQGAHILRVHDVQAAVEVVQLHQLLRSSSSV